MTASAIVLGAAGIMLTFAPDLVLKNLAVDANATSTLLGQIIGALYFGYAMMNWMTKESLIGGIYNRPVAIANFTHFFIAGLAIVKQLLNNPDVPTVAWAAAMVYVVSGISFAIILFRHPIAPDKKTS